MRIGKSGYIVWPCSGRLSNSRTVVGMLLLILALTSCTNPYGTSEPADQSFGVQDSAPSPSPSPDLIDDDGSATGFGAAFYVGTVYNNGILTLNTTINNAELNETWAPQWENLIAYWKLDESAWNGTPGEVRDSMGLNHGVRVGQAGTIPSAKIGTGAGTFDGTGDYLDFGLSDYSSIQALSFSLWFKTTNSGATNVRLVEVGDLNNRISIFKRNDNRLSWYFVRSGAACADLVTVGTYNSGKWHHVVATVSASGLSLFVDGVLENSSSTDCTPFNFPSTSLFYIGQYLGGGNYEWIGEIDDVAFWNTALSKEEVELIYSRQSASYSGLVQSRVIDSLSANPSWMGLDWQTTLPFGKEIPESSESSTTYPLLVGTTQNPGDDDLVTDIMALWHFNEKSLNTVPSGEDFKDSAGTFHLVESGGIEAGASGRFSYAAKFDGTDDSLVAANLPLENKGTIAFWAKDMSLADSNYLFDSSLGSRYLLYRKMSTNEWGLFLGNTIITDTDLDGLIDSTHWTHIAITYDLSHPTVKEIIYKNGRQVASFNIVFTPSTPAQFFIGQRYNNTQHWRGLIDEFGVWSRPLNPKEVLQLYRRGGNRVKFQVRACSQADCSDQSAEEAEGWKGPGGNYFSYFSELLNHSSVSFSCGVPQQCYENELALDGFVQLLSPSLDFGSFGADGIDLMPQRYFQYRAILESDDVNTACDADGVGSDGDSTCLPGLKSVQVRIQE